MAAIGKELGVAGKGDASVVDDAFINRASDQCGELTVQTTVTGTCQSLYHIGTVSDVKFASNHGRRGCNGQYR